MASVKYLKTLLTVELLNSLPVKNGYSCLKVAISIPEPIKAIVTINDFIEKREAP